MFPLAILAVSSSLTRAGVFGLLIEMLVFQLNTFVGITTTYIYRPPLHTHDAITNNQASNICHATTSVMIPGVH